jgi:hypothetical protein
MPKKYSLPMLRNAVPPKYRYLVDRAEAGSLRATLTLKCADCCAWHLAEVRACVVTACALYHVRRTARPERVLTAEQAEARRERGRRLAESRRARQLRPADPDVIDLGGPPPDTAA